MSPLDRRRRSILPAVLVGLVVAAVLALLVGGLLKVGTASGPYHRDVDRSYAAQASVLVLTSNADGAQLRSLMGDMPTMQRVPLSQALDTLVSSTAGTAASTAALSPPPPAGGIDQGVRTAMSDRARGVAEIRTAVDGLLGMSPLPVAGSPGAAAAASSGGGGGTAPLLPPDRAAADIVGAGRLLSAADRDYAVARRELRAAPGGSSLPRSVWVGGSGDWAPGPVQALVDEFTSSPTLAPVVTVILLPHALRVVPSAVPPLPGSPAGVSVLPPTRSLAITVVVWNRGNVAEPRVAVSAQATPEGAGAPVSRSGSVGVGPGAKVAVTLPRLKTVPGRTYTLVVSVTPPAGQTRTDFTSTLSVLRISPLPVVPKTPSPPTTTTPKANPEAKSSSKTTA